MESNTQQLPEGWSEIEIGKYCKLRGGYAFKSSQFIEKGLPVVKIKNIQGVTATLEDSQCIPIELLSGKLEKYKVSNGDVLIAMTGAGSVGRVGIMRCDTEEFGLLNQRVGLYVPNEDKLDRLFLYYNLIMPASQKALFLAGSGSGQPNLSPKQIEAFKIKLPPLSEQKKIAHILGSLDKKIENNRKINETLEAMAQAMFKSWFVDFDPVIDNALAAGNEIPKPLKEKAEKRIALGDQRKSLPPEIQSLFPSTFTYSEDLEQYVPEGWKASISGEIIDVRDGTHDSPKKSEIGFPLLTSKHITSGKIDYSSTYLISEEDYHSVNKRSKVSNGDILLTMIGTVGVPCLVRDEPDFAIKNVGLFRTSQNQNLRFYFYLLLQSQDMQSYLEARMAGTTQKYLSLKVLRNICFLEPCEKILNEFNKVVTKKYVKINELEQEISNLINLRDTLLPKLISGELSVKDLNLEV